MSISEAYLWWEELLQEETDNARRHEARLYAQGRAGSHSRLSGGVPSLDVHGNGHHRKLTDIHQNVSSVKEK